MKWRGQKPLKGGSDGVRCSRVFRISIYGDHVHDGLGVAMSKIDHDAQAEESRLYQAVMDSIYAAAHIHIREAVGSVGELFAQVNAAHRQEKPE